MIQRLHPQTTRIQRHTGFTYVEMVLAVTISAILMAGLMGVINTAFETSDDVRQRNELSREARFAMQRMVQTVSRSQRLLLPLNDSLNTNWPDNIREQTVPPSPPAGDSTLATAVLSVTLPHDIDLDHDATPDADNDGDGLIDEDLPADFTNDNATGIYLIDDMGDGTVDQFSACCSEDDEEDFGIQNDDHVDGIDNDGDGLIDEDPGNDVNGDGCAGICGVDDDGDGSIDETSSWDDDEDGSQNEDWYDPIVYYLNGNTLVERWPVPWDTNFDAQITGRDFVTSTIAENVTRFRVERIETASGDQLVDLVLELTHPQSAENISLQTRVRVGGAL